MTLAQDQSEVFQTGRVLLDQLNRELSCAYQSASATESQLDRGNLNGTAVNLTFITTAHADAARPTGE